MDTSLPLPRIVRAYVELLRPANIVTAWADVMAGFAAAGATLSLTGWTAPVEGSTLALLLLSTTGLYGGGVVLNDVFDASLDADERPDRPIPSGRASRPGAAGFGSILLTAGILFAFLVGPASAIVAFLIAGGAVLYDAQAKHHSVFGPITMGLCRAGNLFLGVSAVSAALLPNWYLLFIPFAFVGAITSISQGEVHGGHRHTGVLALVLVASVLLGLVALGLRSGYDLLHAAPFILLLGIQVVPPFVRATSAPTPERIQDAVKAGVVGLIPLDAALAAGFAGWPYGLVVLLLLLLSIGLSRLFDVT